MKHKDKFRPLYRKENHRTRYGRKKQKHGARHDRNTKDGMSRSMKKNHNKGTHFSYDYTPLFRYLLSRVGDKWADVYADAIPRVNTKEPIFWMVILDSGYRNGVIGTDGDFEMGESFCVGGKSSFSKLYVNEDGILLKVNDKLKVDDFTADCECCTHTFNGQVIKKLDLPYTKTVSE